MQKFEPHRIPYRSRLEKWRAEITSMREVNWPYSRIVDWLKKEAQISVSIEAVRKFCKLRNIRKPAAKEVHSSPALQNKEAEQNGEKKKFKYKDDGPIQTNRQ
ncbi:hypothetical protein N9891_00025 [bacterium]|nr:hypothetical protein [bacterium]